MNQSQRLTRHFLQLALLGASASGMSSRAFAIAQGDDAQTVQLLQSHFVEPCACDSSLGEAFPNVLANRIGKTDDVFLRAQIKMINDFVASTAYPNGDKFLFWTVYELGSSDIANALIAAQEAGAHVSVLTDGKSVLVGKPKDDEDSRFSQDRTVLTRDVYARLKKAGIEVAYSDPEWSPTSTSFSPIMHEKIRILAVRQPGADIRPVFGYIGTHNDTFSDLGGDPLSSVPIERLREGGLQRHELDPNSRGNVNIAFTVRHAGILASLYKNFRDQQKVYKAGGSKGGRIRDVENQKPADFELADGTKIRLSFTYAKSSSAHNPNEDMANFFDQGLEVTQGNEQHEVLSFDKITLEQFVFSYGKVADSLKALAQAGRLPETQLIIDGNFAFQGYSHGRPMAGVFALYPQRTSKPLVFPWADVERKNIRAYAYVNYADKLHAKNTSVRYRTPDGQPRTRVYTGSTNLSGNSVSNKEIFLEIDSACAQFADVIEEQMAAVLGEESARPLNQGALYTRIMGSMRAVGLRPGKKYQEIKESYQKFIQTLGRAQESAMLTISGLNPFSLSADVTRSAWLDSLETFVDDAGSGSPEKLVKDLQKNLKETSRFYPSVPSVEIMLSLTDDAENLNPATRSTILKLFQ